MNELLHEAQRGAMVMAFRAGRSSQEIADFNNISISTVKGLKLVWDQFLEEGGSPDKFNI
jgi:transposase